MRSCRGKAQRKQNTMTNHDANAAGQDDALRIFNGQRDYSRLKIAIK
jgi:hypothetical protein